MNKSFALSILIALGLCAAPSFAMMTDDNDHTSQETPKKTKGTKRKPDDNQKPAPKKRARKTTTDLMRAAARGDMAEMAKLLDAGADVLAQDENGHTVVHHIFLGRAYIPVKGSEALHARLVGPDQNFAKSFITAMRDLFFEEVARGSVDNLTALVDYFRDKFFQGDEVGNRILRLILGSPPAGLKSPSDEMDHQIMAYRRELKKESVKKVIGADGITDLMTQMYASQDEPFDLDEVLETLDNPETDVFATDREGFTAMHHMFFGMQVSHPSSQFLSQLAGVSNYAKVVDDALADVFYVWMDKDNPNPEKLRALIAYLRKDFYENDDANDALERVLKLNKGLLIRSIKSSLKDHHYETSLDFIRQIIDILKEAGSDEANIAEAISANIPKHAGYDDHRAALNISQLDDDVAMS